MVHDFEVVDFDAWAGETLEEEVVLHWESEQLVVALVGDSSNLVEMGLDDFYLQPGNLNLEGEILLGLDQDRDEQVDSRRWRFADV